MENPTKSITSMLDRAGSITRSGIVSGAKILAKGIDKTSELVKTKTSEHTESSEVKFLPQIETASKATSFIVGKSHRLIGKAVNKTLEIAEDAWGSKPESEMMRNLKETKGFQIGKEITMAGANAGMNIIGGVSEGFNLVKDSSVKATVEIVEHKYGENAGKAARETLNIAGDVFGAYRMTYTIGLVTITATEVMRIKEEEAEIEMIYKVLTGIVI